MSNVVNQEYWDSSYSNLNLEYDEKKVLFKKIFEKYLRHNPQGSCIEIGCYPGNFLIYICSKFKYIANGVDTTPYINTKLVPHLKNNNISIGDFFQQDFMSFNPGITYDLVCSFGFIEHFRNMDDVMLKHIELVKPDGTLIISCPNYRKIQYILHKLLDSDNLERHVLETMDLHKMTQILEKYDMEVLFQGYFKTADFWIDSNHQSFLKPVLSQCITYVFSIINKYVDKPNSWLSPYMICIAKKKNSPNNSTNVKKIL
ncbi:methyltransferase domain-containing protein [Methanolobus sediminis]|uniref:Methyltransferase domain-containing protein n=1 Tax=Methanolobus sediminis TaxID=3072978 RepID=A0AA51UIT0_9EURY|nr:methyltransferase domain-containing protein [Methanolobus sediminis]WMW24306.1 methyltransferase domain-containing protein [Methanolobus sediminis]